jgi:ATP synthase F0 subunit b
VSGVVAMMSAGLIAGKFRPAGLLFLLSFAFLACCAPADAVAATVETGAAAEAHADDAHAGGGHETGKFAWKPMIEGLDKREASIRSAIVEAEENRKKAEAMLADYQKKLKEAEQHVQSMIAEARRDAERTSQDLIAAAQRDVDLLRQRTKDEIRQAKDAALADVFSQLNTQVVLATEHVLGRALQDSDQERLVSEALASIAR